MVHFLPKKIWVNFLFVKTPNRGGGVEGGLVNHQTFPHFFVKPSLIQIKIVRIINVLLKKHTTRTEGGLTIYALAGAGERSDTGYKKLGL